MSEALRQELKRLDDEWSKRGLDLTERTKPLALEGRYEEAADLVDAHLAAWLEMFTPERIEGYTKLNLSGPIRERSYRELSQALRRRAELAARASHEYGAAQALLVELTTTSTWALERVPLTDPHVQALLDAVRQFHAGTSALFSGRALRLDLSAVDLNDELRARYADALASELAPLGLRARVDRGDEVFKVSALLDGPYSAGWIGDDVMMGDLHATATWIGTSLGELTLNGKAAVSGDALACAEAMIDDSAESAGWKILEAWAKSPDYRA